MNERMREEVEAEVKIDLTPMIDTVFLLIIFFLCIDFKILEAKLPAYLPKDVGTHSTNVEPQEKLHVQIVCTSWGDEVPRRQLTDMEIEAGERPSYRLVGHTIHWRVGPTPIHEFDQLTETLSEVADDPTNLQTDPETGKTELMAVVIEPGPDTTYGDVARTLDAVTAAGFEDISFGGGLGSRQSRGKG